MITPMQVYWITRLDGINEFLIIMAFILFLVLVGIIISRNIDDKKIWDKTTFKLSFIAIILFFLAVFIPTTKEMVTIYMLPKIANSQMVQELPDDMKNLKLMALEYLKDQLSPKKEK